MSKPGPLEIIEGFYATHIANHFHRHGVFERLNGDRSVYDIAGELGYDVELLSALFDYLHHTTAILKRARSGNYAVAARYQHYFYLGFQLDKFIGSYGPAIEDLEQALRSPTLGRNLVDRKTEARAYRVLESPPHPWVGRIVAERRINSILDLGCGPGTLLTELCEANPRFQGWGIDENANMCREAKQRIAKAGLTGRIRIIHGDARSLGKHLPSRARLRIESLQSKGLMNELFRFDNRQAIAYLKRLRGLFPGRLLFVVDYYGKLTRAPKFTARYRHTFLHDVIQFVTAQGVPPADLAGWAEVYHAAGCSVEHAYEGEGHGIEWFVHLVRL